MLLAAQQQQVPVCEGHALLLLHAAARSGDTELARLTEQTMRRCGIAVGLDAHRAVAHALFRGRRYMDAYRRLAAGSATDAAYARRALLGIAACTLHRLDDVADAVHQLCRWWRLTRPPAPSTSTHEAVPEAQQQLLTDLVLALAARLASMAADDDASRSVRQRLLQQLWALLHASGAAIDRELVRAMAIGHARTGHTPRARYGVG